MSGIPDAWFDGVQRVLGGIAGGNMFSSYNPIVNGRLAVSSPLFMKSSYRLQSATAGSLYVEIDVTAPVTTTSNIAHFAIVEEGLTTYGITPGLGRDMLTDESFTLTQVGQSVTYQKAFTLDPSWNMDNIYFVSFVQSHGTTKEVLQASRAERAIGIRVTPLDNLVSTGNPGGPFTPASITYTVENASPSATDYEVTATQPWLTITSASGTLIGHGSVQVTVGFNQLATLLGAGLYRDTVTFTDLTSHVGDCTRTVSLETGQRTLAYSFPLDSDPGWTCEDLWAWGQPLGGGGAQGFLDPTSGHTGPNCYGYNLAGDYQNNLPERHLTSGAIDCTGVSGVRLKFWRRLNVDAPASDHAYVRVSNDNTTWTTVWENPATLTEGSWSQQDYDIGAVADGRPQVYLRWTMGTTNGSGQFSGWNIDDIELWAIVNGTSGVADAPGGPKLQLYQNVPNPFVGATTIAYELPSPADVRITVYDVAGRLVREIVNESLDAGIHAARWDGIDASGQRVASGVYFARLEAGNASQTRRIVLLR